MNSREAPWRAVGEMPPQNLACRELRLMANVVDRWASERASADECARLQHAAELLREAARELAVRDALGKWFTSEGYAAHPSSSAREALETIQKKEFDIALLDIKMPGMDGMELQARLKQADPDLTVIMMTGYASVETAVQALKRGAYDYVTKPVNPDELSHLVANALEHKRASREVARLREDLLEISPGTELIGRSPAT